MPEKKRQRVRPEALIPIFKDLNYSLEGMVFRPPVEHVYNPLLYAHRPFAQYLETYLAGPTGRTLLLGMNPGPWGMAQTGVPFGEIAAVRDWLGICAKVDVPASTHPKRPIEGFDCSRSEVSGRRLWGFFQDLTERPEQFAERFVIINYCPLIFLEDSGRNRIPEKLPKAEREPLFEACDRALDRLLQELQPSRLLGVGKFALRCLEAAHRRLELTAQTPQSILHPSPANPQANKGWAERVKPILLQGTSS